MSSDPAVFAPHRNPQILASPPQESQLAGDAVCVQELAIWLRALRSFFLLDNYPLAESARARPHTRDFTDDVSIVRQVLRRCLLLCLSEAEGGRRPLTETDGQGWAEVNRLMQGVSVAEYAEPTSSGSLTRVLADLSSLCGSLVERGEVTFRSWTGLGSVLGRELEGTGMLARGGRKSPLESLSRAQPELLKLACGLREESFAGGVLTAFSHLSLALEQLKLVEGLMRADRPLKQSLPVFTLVHEEARAASAVLERLSLLAAEGGGDWYEVLDSALYALGMELSKVFNRELIGLASMRSANEIYARTESATYLLRDCCQQTTFVLAQTLDPELECARLFQSITIRLQQSLKLREELWGVLESVRSAERERERSPLAPLLARLRAFQSGGMRHLMYKDWESFERFVAEVAAARGHAELGPVLHRFATYLEALFTQINMRAVLADFPFDFPKSDQ